MQNRRRFLQSATASVAISPLILSSGHAFQSGEKRTIAAIGVGGSRGRYNRGGNVANQAARLGKMIAVVDVDDRHTSEFSEKHGGNLSKYRDHREMLEKEKPDVVTIGTPDHWHVPISIDAMRAGCDVYCEKPLTLTIAEGMEVRKVVEETGRVFQVGTQQRSEYDQRFLKAIALVQSGRLGKNVNAYVAIGGAPAGGPFEPQTAPTDLDWDRWVGPAMAADYSEKRRKMFRWFFEYSGGKMTDWGAHHIDIAQWALGQADSGPVSVAAKGSFPPLVPDDFDWVAFMSGEAKLPSGFNTATKFNIELKFANGAVLSVNNHYRREDGTDFGNGILIEGEDGRIFVNRGKLTGKPVDDLTESDDKELEEAIAKLYKGKPMVGHMRNFFECMEDRTQPISDVASHHRVMTSCHLCNIGLMLGRDLTWDPENEKFMGDDQANALMTRPKRDKYA